MGDDVVSAEPENIFSLAWVLTMVFVVLIVGLGVFYGVTRLHRNTEAVAEVCVARNRQIAVVNARFVQLTDLIDASIRHAQPNAPPPAPEVLHLLVELKVPIPPVSCGGISE